MKIKDEENIPLSKLLLPEFESMYAKQFEQAGETEEGEGVKKKYVWPEAPASAQEMVDKFLPKGGSLEAFLKAKESLKGQIEDKENVAPDNETTQELEALNYLIDNEEALATMKAMALAGNWFLKLALKKNPDLPELSDVFAESFTLLPNLFSLSKQNQEISGVRLTNIETQIKILNEKVNQLVAVVEQIRCETQKESIISDAPRPANV